MRNVLFETFIDSASDPILVCNDEGRVRLTNPAATRLYGALGGKRIHEIIWPGGQDVFASIWSRVLEGQTVIEQPVETALQDTTRLMTNASFVPVEGDEVQILCTLKDAVEFRRLFSQLVQAEKMASLGRLASGIAHQLNTPLGSILLTSQMLQDSAADEEATRDLEKIIRQTTQCRDIISNFLALSRAPGELDRNEMFTLSGVIEEIVELLSKSLREKKIVVSHDFQCGACRIYGNRTLLNQLFVNLLSNALDVMPGGGTIRISTECAPGLVKVLLADEGGGIPEAHRQSIFDPFFTTKPMGQGTGLGLYIAHRIAQEHGGTLELRESTAAGSTFEVSLPLACAIPK